MDIGIGVMHMCQTDNTLTITVIEWQLSECKGMQCRQITGWKDKIKVGDGHYDSSCLLSRWGLFECDKMTHEWSRSLYSEIWCGVNSL